MKTYEVTLHVKYVKRYIANSAKEAMEAMDFDYINLYIQDEMGEPDAPQIFDFSWHIDPPKKVKNDQNIFARDVRGIFDEEEV